MPDIFENWTFSSFFVKNWNDANEYIPEHINNILRKKVNRKQTQSAEVGNAR